MKIMSTIAENLIHFALTRGITYGIKPSTITTDNKISSTGFAVHAPFTLEPYKYPKKAFDDAVELAPIFNNLVDKISRDSVWLNTVLASTASSDTFTSKLLEIMNVIEKEGGQQDINLGIIRSDYMLHNVPMDPRCILQVEINTVASSAGSLSTKISDMHSLFYKNQNIPQNIALATLSESLAYAHFMYLSQTQSPDAVVIMVIQHGERNFADQRHLDFTLLESYDVRMIRLSLDEIHLKCSLDSSSRALMYEGCPVSVVYYRAGYSPDDYRSTEDWDARIKIERSSAIKCPSIGLHLAGCKKVQQVITRPGQLERFVADTNHRKLLRNVFAGLYSLDSAEYEAGQSESQPTATKRVKIDSNIDDAETVTASFDDICLKVITHPERYVMKPQREGGGNNIYGQAVAQSLQTMSRADLKAFILMERIFPPSQVATLVREGVLLDDVTLCELGVYGVYLSDKSGIFPISSLHQIVSQYHQSKSNGNTSESSQNYNKYAGFLLRVKATHLDEGGLATGYSVLSSPSIVDKIPN